MGAWDEALGGFSDWLASADCSPRTIRLRVGYLIRLALRYPDRDPWSLTVDDLTGFLAYEGWAPETRKSARAAVRSFYRWALDTERVTRNPAAKLPAITIPPTIPRPAPESVVVRALAFTDSVRDRVMILLAAAAGLRRAEIAELHTRCRVGDMLRITGKGGRTRTVPIGPHLLELLQAIEADQGAGYYFPGLTQGHLSPGHVGKILKKLLGPDWSAHCLRHRFATKAYAADRDLLAVQQLLGHAKPETTQRYTALPQDALRRAAAAARIA